jgi:glc operon protein GlcG
LPISLPTKPYLTMDAARAIADAAVAEATKQNLRMAIAIVDTGGHLLYFLRMSEQIAPGAADACIGKAQSAAMFSRATASWEEAAKERPVVMKIPNVMPLGGGVPLIANGVSVGAIGVSGASSAKDDEIAKVGAAALG